MGDVLAVVEQREGKLRGVSSEVVSVAATMAQGSGGGPCSCRRGAGAASGASDLGRFGAEKILLAEMAALAVYHPQGYAQVVTEAVKKGGYGAVVFGATAQGKDLAPRVAALLDVPLASDVTEVEMEGVALWRFVRSSPGRLLPL